MKIDAPRLEEFESLLSLDALPDEDEFEGLLLEGADLTGRDLHSREFRGCILHKCTLTDCDLRRVGFTDVILDHCDLSGANLEDAVFVRSHADVCRMTGADLIHALLRQTRLTGCKLDFLNLAEAKCDHVLWEDCILQEASIESAALKAEFDRCDFTRATIHRTAMKGLDLRTCTLTGLSIGLGDLYGMVVTPLQAAELARLMGLVIR